LACGKGRCLEFISLPDRLRQSGRLRKNLNPYPTRNDFSFSFLMFSLFISQFVVNQ
jgi:hypothetical protein